MSLRVLVVEDHPLFRRGVVALLEAADGLVTAFELGVSAEELQRRTDLVRQELSKLTEHSPSFLLALMLRLFAD